MNWTRSWKRCLVDQRQRLLTRFDFTVQNGLGRCFKSTTNDKTDGDDHQATAKNLKRKIFRTYAQGEEKLNVSSLLAGLERTGIRRTDLRLSSFVSDLQQLHEKGGNFSAVPESMNLDFDAFDRLMEKNLILFDAAFHRDLVVPDFENFCHNIRDIYLKCKVNNQGEVATYIPQLARHDKTSWGVSICTVDGQRFSIGDVNTQFTLQSCSKPFTYAMCLTDLGADLTHDYVHHEPSGRNFNEICLDSENKPHNPMLNSGAIILSSLLLEVLKPNMKHAEKFDYVLDYMRRVAGNETVTFNNAVFLSERETAHRNFAMAYFMKENRCFPKGADLHKCMDLYFQTCSLEVNTEALGVMGATLANGGLCPVTSEKVFDPSSVRNVLSLMFSCGMYNHSGKFAFNVGLPAKSGVSGALVLVIPNVMGIGLWSPPLDRVGNSSRCLQFCEDLVDRFNFHHFDNLRLSAQKCDPRRGSHEKKATTTVTLMFAAKAGDKTAMERLLMQGVDFNAKDYDSRTALHVAAAEGHYNCVQFLIEKASVIADATDRWGYSACDEAVRFGHKDVADYLRPLE